MTERLPRRPCGAPRVRRAPRLAAALVLAGTATIVLGGTGSATARSDPHDAIATPATPPLTAPDAVVDRARETLAAGLPGHDLPAAVVVADRTTTSARGIGRSGGHAVDADTRFVIGSTSKSFTALATMQLVDDGRVDLDAPVRQYVPELALADSGATSRITVRQILQQTSGLPASAGGPVLKSAADGDSLAAVRELRDVELTAEPGQRWQYANANYVLAGLIVERASGLTYGEYLKQHIFDPLGMTHSSADGAPARVRADHLATGHRIWFGVPVASGPTIRPGLVAAGYIVSTADDLGRYLQVFLNDGTAPDGVRIVSSRSLQTLLAPGPQAHLGPWADAAEARYAMGWFVGGSWQQTVTFHPGNSPDSSAMIALAPGRGLAVATLIGAGHNPPLPGEPSAIDRLSRNTVAATLGEPARQGATIQQFSLWFDLVALTLVAAAGWPLVRAVRAVRKDRALRGSRVAHRHAWLGSTVGLVVRLAPAALLLGAPQIVGYGWSALWTWAPDLALSLAVPAALIVATAGTRIAVHAEPLRRKGSGLRIPRRVAEPTGAGGEDLQS